MKFGEDCKKISRKFEKIDEEGLENHNEVEMFVTHHNLGVTQ